MVNQNKKVLYMKHYRQLIKLILAFLLGFSIAMPSVAKDDDTYDQDSILKDATEFFGTTTEGLAKLVEKAFKERF